MLSYFDNTSWILYPKNNLHAKANIFCFPYAGGSTQIFSSWPAHLPSFINVCSVQLPGRMNLSHVPPYTLIDSLVPVLYEQLSPLFLQKPFFLYGYSLGGLLAFELAKIHIKHQAAMPLQLFISACAGPSEISNYEPIHLLPDKQFIERIKKYNGTPKEILKDEDFLSMITPILKADFSMFHNYTYRPTGALPCPITAIGGTDDIFVSEKQLLMWSQETNNQFVSKIIKGDHFFINSNRIELLKIISDDVLIYEKNL